MPPRPVRSHSQLIRATNVTVVRRATARARTLTTVSLSVGSGTAASAPWVRVSCSIPRQEQDNWCWCATTLGVHRYFTPTDVTTQCAAADRILSRTDACVNPGGPSVNIPYYLDKALGIYGHLRGPSIGPAPPAQVASEIQSNVPVCTRIGWSSGGGHFMALVGYLDAIIPRVEISDPIFGRSELDYDLYLKAYQGNGHWTHTYLTQ